MQVQQPYQQPNFQTPTYIMSSNASEQIQYEPVSLKSESTTLQESAEKTNTATQDLFYSKISECCLPAHQVSAEDERRAKGFATGFGCGLGWGCLACIAPGTGAWIYGNCYNFPAAVLAGKSLVSIGASVICLCPFVGCAVASIKSC